MLEDRDYMRSDGGSFRPSQPVTVKLVIVLVACFVAQFVIENFTKIDLGAFAYLSLEGIKSGYVWQFITFQFMHGGILHILLNGLVIYFFGRAIEDVLGPRRFLQLYFTSGVMGGLLEVILAFLFPERFGGSVLGASAGAYGLMAAYATLNPHRRITLLLFFILPVTFAARVLLWIFGGMAVLGILGRFGNNAMADGIAHGAHLGGLIFGVMTIRWFYQGGDLADFNPFKGMGGSGGGTRARKPGRKQAPIINVEVEPSDDFISKQVDPILDKISRKGINSLTEQERKILEKARQNMKR